MRLIDGHHDGDLRVTGYVGVSGVVTGSVYVESGRLTLTGTILGDLVVHSGVASLFGAVSGDVINHAGEVVLTSPALHRSGEPVVKPVRASVDDLGSVAFANPVAAASTPPRRPTAPWRYAPDAENPRLRLQRWRRLVVVTAVALLAVVVLVAALVLGGRTGQEFDVAPTESAALNSFG